MAFNPRVEAFQNENFAGGYDHKRSVAQFAFGHYVAAEAATWESGMVVDLDASGNVIKSVGVAPFGIAKFSKNTGKTAAVVGEYIQCFHAVATNLKHSNLFDPTAGAVDTGIRLHNGAGVVYTVGAGHYAVNYVNGTVTTANVGGAPADGAFLYVDYAYNVSSTDLARDGLNFWNQANDTTQQGNKCVIVNGRGRIFTSQFYPSDTYAVNGVVNAGVVADGLDGLVRSGGAGLAIGKVFQVPTADDPYLGIELSL